VSGEATREGEGSLTDGMVVLSAGEEEIETALNGLPLLGLLLPLTETRSPPSTIGPSIPAFSLWSVLRTLRGRGGEENSITRETEGAAAAEAETATGGEFMKAELLVLLRGDVSS
jgi:hypothetical protein